MERKAVRIRDAYDGSALQNRADDPDDTREDYGLFATESIGQSADGKRAYERTRRHCGDNCTLSIRTGLREANVS